VPGSGPAANVALADPSQPQAEVWPDVDQLSVAAPRQNKPSKESIMSVYRVTEVIGTSGTSWEDAAAEAIRAAAGTIHDLRVAEVVKQDIHLDEGGAITYRTKLQLSFKYEREH
jgi:flavin-binding protein dodecin